MRVLKKSIWDASYFAQIGISEGHNKVSGAEMLIEIEFECPINRDYLKSSLVKLITSFSELQTIWIPKKKQSIFRQIKEKQLERELNILESFFKKTYQREEIFSPLGHEAPQSESSLPFRCLLIGNQTLVVSALHTHFHGVSMYAYIDILLHFYFEKIGTVQNNEVQSRIKMYNRQVPKLLALIHTTVFPIKMAQTFLSLKKFHKKAQKASKSKKLPSWANTKHIGRSQFVHKYWTLEEREQTQLLTHSKKSGLSPSQYIVTKLAKEFLNDQKGSRDRCFFYMPTNEVRNTPGASILHLGSHVGSCWLQYSKDDDIKEETRKSWKKIVKKQIPYWLMIFMRLKTKCLQTAIKERNETILKTVPHELDDFSNADLVISNGGKAPPSSINRFIKNIRCFGKSYHYPFLVIGTFENNMNFLFTYNSSLYGPELINKMNNIIKSIKEEISHVENDDLKVTNSLGSGFTTLRDKK